MPDPAPPPQWEALQRTEAAHLMASVSGHSFDEAMLIVAALESDGVFIVREVPSENGHYRTE